MKRLGLGLKKVKRQNKIIILLGENMDMPEMKVFKDGDSWFFALPDFVNFQIGPASFSNDCVYSLDEVYEDLLNQKEQNK